MDSPSTPQLQVWAIDISGYSATGSSSSPSLSCSIDRLLCNLNSPFGSGRTEAEMVRKYVRDIDKIRALASKVLPRLMYTTYYKECTWTNMKFEVTKEGRPFLARPILQDPVDFNISHDASWVVLAFHLPTSPSEDSQISINFTPERRLGIDIMRLSLPHFEDSPKRFGETMEMNLTDREMEWVLEPYLSESRDELIKDFAYSKVESSQGSSDQTTGLEQKRIREHGDGNQDLETLSRIYDLWTHKEAFTKLEGQGLGFDFKKVEIQFWNSRYRSRRDTETLAELKGRGREEGQVKEKEEGFQVSQRELQASKICESETNQEFSMEGYKQHLEERSGSEVYALERTRSSGSSSNITNDSKTETIKGNNTILGVHGTLSSNYKFTEIIFPDGTFKDESQGKEKVIPVQSNSPSPSLSTTSTSRNDSTPAFKSTGSSVASQCVIVEELLTDGEEKRSSQVREALSAREAVEVGLLKIWGMEELLKKSWAVGDGEIHS